MLTRIEIDGFKTFENFGLDLRPLTAIVGPNASGKSNLFDALRFVSLLAQYDIRRAMQDLRGKPEELFRQTPAGTSGRMSFAVEVLLSRKGVDAFGTTYETPATRLRYELQLGVNRGSDGIPKGVIVLEERCTPISRKDDRATYLLKSQVSYNARVNPFIKVSDSGDAILNSARWSAKAWAAGAVVIERSLSNRSINNNNSGISSSVCSSRDTHRDAVFGDKSASR